MRSRDDPVLDRIRQPAYTGENRCLPCTVLNVAIAFLATVLAAPLGPVAVAVVFAASMGSIYFRGYLIPGTPTLTKRYLPAPVLEAFGKEPPGPREGWEAAEEPANTDDRPDDNGDPEIDAHAESDAASEVDAHAEVDGENGAASGIDDAESDTGNEAADGDGGENDAEFETVERIQNRRENAVDPIEFLLDGGVVVPTDGPEALAFEESFADRIATHVDRLDEGAVPPAVLAELFDVDPAEIEFQNRSYPAITVRRRVRKWPGDAAYLADVASHLALVEHTDGWIDVPAEQRLSILQSLRSFHADCPVCGGELAATADTVESCCLAHEVVAIRCDDCGEHVLELDPQEIESVGTETGITP